MPGWLQVRLGVPMLITTLLLNYVGALFAAWVVTYPLRDLAAGGVAQTVAIPDAAQLPDLAPGGRLHLGVLVILVLPLVAWWLQRRTVVGYELRMVGHNRGFADYGGVDGRRVLLTMLLSGAICGLAGALVVLGVNHRYIDGVITTPGWAWSGFTAAILTGADPVLTLVRRPVPAGARGRRRGHGAATRTSRSSSSTSSRPRSSSSSRSGSILRALASGRAARGPR